MLSNDDLDRTTTAKSEVLGHTAFLVSTWTCFVNSVKSFLGTGILLVSYSLAQVGWAWGLCAFFLCFAVELYCLQLLVDVKRTLRKRFEDGEELEESDGEFLMDNKEDSSDGLVPNPEYQRHRNAAQEVRTYPSIGAVLGGRRLIDFFMLTSQYGFMVAYFTFLGSNLHSLFSDVPKIVFMILCVPIAMGLVLVPTLKHMGPLAIIGTVLFVMGYLFVSVYCFKEWFFSDHHHTVKAGFPSGMSFLDVFQSLSVSIYTFEGIAQVMSNEESIRNKKKFKFVASAAMSSYFMFAMFIGLAGYFSYGEEVKDILLLNLSKSDPLVKVVKLMFVVGSILGYPLMLWPNVERIEEIWGWDQPKFAEEVGANTAFRKRVVLRLGSVFGCGVTALLIPDFDLVAALIGGLCSSALAITIPAYLALKCYPDASNRKRKTWWAILVIGVVASAICTGVAFYNIVDRLVG